MADKSRRTFVFHPFLFAVYAVLGVYSRNAIDVPVQWVLRPMLVMLILAAVVYYVLRKRTGDGDGDRQYAGLVTTLAIFWFFFGHFQRALFEKSPFWGTTPGALLAFLLWTVPFAFLGSKWAWKQISNRRLVTTFLNLTSVLVVLIPLYLTGGALIQTIQQIRAHDAQRSANPALVLEAGAASPDIYLIILDGYGREDFLREVYGFDNSQFIAGLEQRGFYVAKQSTTNYPQTLLSLSSILNLQYLDGLTKGLQNTSAREPVVDLLQHSDVRRSLHNAGYRFVSLPSTAFTTQIPDADVYLGMTWGNLNDFEGLLLSSTVINFAIDAWDWNVPVPNYGLHRRYILFSLDKLETAADIAGPKFVLAHIMAPHPPFVLDERGNPVQSERPYNTGDASGFQGTHAEYIAGYDSEARYLNQRVLKIIDEILAHSDRPPIIIMQGDHGPGNYFNTAEANNTCLRERYSILNAYYFPDRDYRALYPTISPVNSFRVVFNQYFGTDLEILEDKSYYATWLAPYRFIDVSAEIQSCKVAPDN